MTLEYDTDALTYDDCLDGHGDSPCEGEMDFYPSYYGRGAFPRCAGHYIAYCERIEERERKYAEVEASMYCEHGTYIGSWDGPDYLCGRCENGE